MELTEDQKAVVALDEGQHLVLAPPGSGKTEMLSQRILRAVLYGFRLSRRQAAVEEGSCGGLGETREFGGGRPVGRR